VALRSGAQDERCRTGCGHKQKIWRADTNESRPPREQRRTVRCQTTRTANTRGKPKRGRNINPSNKKNHGVKRAQMAKIDRPTYDKRTKRTGCRLATGVGVALLAALVGDGGRHTRYDGWIEVRGVGVKNRGRSSSLVTVTKLAPKQPFSSPI